MEFLCIRFNKSVFGVALIILSALIFCAGILLTTHKVKAASTCSTDYNNSFCGEFYNNITLTGTPVANTTLPTPDSNWTSGAAPMAGVNTTGFSAKFVGNFYFENRTYSFQEISDDGFRLYVDGSLLIDNWIVQAPNTVYTGTKSMTAGYHQILINYYQNEGGSVFKLSWKNTIATMAVYTGTAFNTLNSTTYYTSSPSFTYDWGTGGPNSLTDSFSIRWKGIYYFTGRTVNFTVSGDDGVRVYIDSTLVLNGWKDQGVTAYTASYTPTAGYHTLIYEYYENGGSAYASFTYNDTDAPTTGYTSASTTATTSQPVTVTAYMGVDYYQNVSNVRCGTTSAMNSTGNGAYCSAVFSGNGTFYYQTFDSLGNNSPVGTYTVSNIDTTAPVGGAFAFIKGPIYINNPNINLIMTCPTDSWSPVRVAYGLSANPSNWTDCITSIPMSLGSGDGIKTVYVRFSDAGGNATSDTSKFLVLDTSVPVSQSANQYKGDGLTIIPVDTSTLVGETSIVLKSIVSDQFLYSGDNMFAEFEVKPVSTPFDGNNIIKSNAVSATGNPETITVTLDGLATGVDYHWRYRVFDSAGNIGDWISYGNNPETARDFSLASVAKIEFNKPGVNIVNSDTGDNIVTDGTAANQNVNVEVESSGGMPIGELKVDLSINRNWDDLSAGSAGGKAFMHYPEGFASLPGNNSSSFTLAIPKGDGSKVWICPGAAALAEISFACQNGYYLTDGQTLDGATASVVSKNGTDFWEISGLTGTGGMSVITGLQDTLSRLEVGESSNHTITFGTNYGLSAGSNDTLVLTLPGFDLSLLTISDITLTDNSNNIRTLATNASDGVWGVVINNTDQTITFSVPTSGTGGYAAASQIVLKMGMNAVAGVNQMVNPQSAGTYHLSIVLNNAEVENGNLAVPIVDSDQVNIIGYVNTFINFDIDTGTTDSDCAYNACLNHSGGTSATNYVVDLGELNSTWVNKSEDTSVMHSDGNNGTINSIYFDLTTNAYNGAVLYVKSANGALQGPGTSLITAVTDGSNIQANDGKYGFQLTDPGSGNGTILRNASCSTTTSYCGLGTSQKEVFNTNGKPLDNGRLRMDLGAAAAYINNPGAYTDTLTFLVTATF